MAWAELQELTISAQEACSALLPPPAPRGPLNLTERVCSLMVGIPQAMSYAVHQEAMAALTLAKLQLPRANLGAVALGIPEDTSDKALEIVEDTIAPLVVAAMNIIAMLRCWSMTSQTRWKGLLLHHLLHHLRKKLAVIFVVVILGACPFEQWCARGAPMC